MPRVAAMIVARDAAQTIGSAIASALAQPIDKLLVVDDGSKDPTLDVARSVSDSRLRLLEIDNHKTLGYARGYGLERLESDFCFLLDADDTFLEGRVERLLEVLKRDELDFVADEVELVEGETGAFIRRMPIPGFLNDPPGLLRLFERNHLPGIGQIGFRVESFRRIGYDPDAHGVEDTDLVLRALIAGYRYGLVREVGYRMSHFPGSVSRNRERQADELAKILMKHDPEIIRDRWMATGATKRQTLWGLLSFELYRRRFEAASELLSKIEPLVIDDDEILEPSGPCPRPESWRINFYRGVIRLLHDCDPKSAIESFEKARIVNENPETLNNLGVALAKIGEKREANEYFEKGLTLRPDFADAAANLKSNGLANRVTVHPLRIEASRSEYV